MHTRRTYGPHGSHQDRDEFVTYLRACTDEQVRGVWLKERAANRQHYVQLAVAEANRRGLCL